MKTIPDADEDLIAEAGRYADGLSINIELPNQESLAQFAGEKNNRAIRRTMARLKLKIDEGSEEKRELPFVPAGQSTQMMSGRMAPAIASSSTPARTFLGSMD